MEKGIVLQTIDLAYIIPKTTKRILRNVNLKVKNNQIVSIVGKVGGGKSTLFRLLNGIMKPYSGDVIVNGRSIFSDGQHFKDHQDIGLLFENPDDQIFYAIVADDIAFGPRNQGLSKKEIHNRVIESCTELGILHLLDRETASLSLGEKTLVALAGLLAMKTEILLMDNVTLGLDLWTKPKILELIYNLRKSHTLILSSNDSDVLKMSDQIYLLWDGTIRGKFNSFAEFKKALST